MRVSLVCIRGGDLQARALSEPELANRHHRLCPGRAAARSHLSQDDMPVHCPDSLGMRLASCERARVCLVAVAVPAINFELLRPKPTKTVSLPLFMMLMITSP